MACSKVIHGQCSRCGRVGESHFQDPRLKDRSKPHRQPGVDTFFSKRKKGFPSAAQLRLFSAKV